MAAITICSDFWAQENKVSHCFHCFPIYLSWSDGPDAMIFVFWMLSFKPTISLSSFTFIKRLFSSSSLSAIKVGSSAYLRLLIFLPAILIPACASSSLAFHMMYSAYKLNKQGDNTQPWHNPFPIWNQSVVPCIYHSLCSRRTDNSKRKHNSGITKPTFKIFIRVLYSTIVLSLKPDKWFRFPGAIEDNRTWIIYLLSDFFKLFLSGYNMRPRSRLATVKLKE